MFRLKYDNSTGVIVTQDIALRAEQSFVQNSPKEKLLIELQNAAGTTKERLQVEKEKEMNEVRKRMELDYANTMKELTKKWYGIGNKEFARFSTETREMLELLLYEKSKKSIFLKSIFSVAVQVGIFVLFATYVTVPLAVIYAVVFTPVWCIMEEEQSFIRTRKKLKHFS